MKVKKQNIIPWASVWCGVVSTTLWLGLCFMILWELGA